MPNYMSRASRTPLPVHSRNPRRAYDIDGCEITPMTFQQAMDKGVRAVRVICDCGHVDETPIYVGAWPSMSFVPDAGVTLRCSVCGTPDLRAEPAWPRPTAYDQLLSAENASAKKCGVR
ncbi:hypothetical protein [Methylobacterium radiotolerans]|uniref:hypothetical protein n=1 Tax=Methylobacterium radiotolerans TaxID=31998 RepID=UPI001F3A893C|nr:hypothetical protein [Methylobacterium radiotolerans]UIY43203.1 hypothetical protein LZ599_05505 [Methylobacterium radiotolerans]